MVEEPAHIAELFVTENGQCGQVAYRRKVTIERHEEGGYNRLIRELKDIAEVYDVDFEDVMQIF